jgi:hypothetical protein
MSKKPAIDLTAVSATAVAALSAEQAAKLTAKPVGGWIVFESKLRNDKARVCLNKGGFVHANVAGTPISEKVEGGCAGVSRRYLAADLGALLCALVDGSPVESKAKASETAAIDIAALIAAKAEETE